MKAFMEFDIFVPLMDKQKELVATAIANKDLN